MYRYTLAVGFSFDWLTAGVVAAAFTGLALIYKTFKRENRTDTEKIVSNFQTLVAEEKALIVEYQSRLVSQAKENEAYLRKRDKKIEDLQQLYDDLREGHRKATEASWEEHRKCLEREHDVEMRLASHEKALTEAGIPFDKYVKQPN